MSTQGITNRQDTPSPVAPQQGDGRNVSTTTDRPVIENPTTLSAEEQIQKRAEANIYTKRFLDPHEIHDSAYIDHADDLISDIRKGINIDINAEELEYVCYKVITLEGKKASLENRIRAAVFLAELYSEFKNARFYNPGKALQILSCALAFGNEKDTCGNISIRPGLPAIDVKTMAGRDITTEELRIPDEARLRMPGISSLAMAQYYDIKTRDANHDKDPDLFRSAIKNLVESLATAEKDLNVPGRVYNTSTYEEALKQRGWALVQAYSILAKLYNARNLSGDKQTAVEICNMLLEGGKKPLKVNDKNGAEIDGPIIKADIPYFRTSAVFLRAVIRSEAKNISQKEASDLITVFDSIIKSTDSDPYMAVTSKRIKADLLMRLDIRDEARKESVLKEAKALYTDVLHSGNSDNFSKSKAAAGLAQIALNLEKDPAKAAALSSAVLGEGNSRVETGGAAAATVPAMKNDPNTSAMTRITNIEAGISLLQSRMTEIFRKNKDLSTKEIEALPEYKAAADALLAERKTAVGVLNGIINSADSVNIYTKQYAALILAKIYLLSDETHSISESGQGQEPPMALDARTARAILSGINTSDGYIAASRDLKLAQANVVLHLNNENNDGSYIRSAADKCTQILGNCPYSDIKREAALTLGMTLQAQKKPADAQNVFAAALNGGSVTLNGQTYAIPKIKDNDDFNGTKASVGLAESTRGITPRNIEEKRAQRTAMLDTLDKAEENSSDAFTRDAARLDRAEILAERKADLTEAKELFESVDTSNRTNSLRAKLGLALIGLSENNASKDIEKSVSGLISVVNGCGNDRALASIKQRAMIELANYLSRFDATKSVALAILDGLIDGADCQTPNIEEIRSGLKKESGKSSEELSSAINLFNDPAFSSGLSGIVPAVQKISDDDHYLIASARMQRADLLFGQNTEESRKAAYEDASEIGRLCSIAPENDNRPYVYDPRIELQTKAGELLSKIRSGDIPSRRVSGEIAGIIDQTKQAVAEGAVEETPDSYAYLKLEELNNKVALWDPSGDARDRGTSGEIIAEYQSLIMSSESSGATVITYMAKQGLINAFNKFGMTKEAKALTEEISKAPDQLVLPHVSADILSKMGIYEIGNSRFKIAAQYSQEAQKRDANNTDAIVYEARARYLLEEFEPGKLAALLGRDPKAGFEQTFEKALNKIWETVPGEKGEQPKLKTFVIDILEEKGDFASISSSIQGRQFILTALEADAKSCFDKGKTLDAMKRYEKAIALLSTWKNNGLDVKADYLFDVQMHYDLASCYAARGRLYDAYLEYKYVKDNGVSKGSIPGWWVEDQLRVLNPERVTIEKTHDGETDKEALNVALRKLFEQGQMTLVANKDGARAEGLLFLDKDKKQSVRVYFGAVKGGSYNAGAGYQIDLNRVKLSAGIDYASSEYEAIDEDGNKHSRRSQQITGKIGAEYRVSRHTTVGVSGKATHHIGQGPSYTSYELQAYLNYARRIGRDATFYANLNLIYSTRRVALEKTGWRDLTPQTSSLNTESGWQWEDSINGPISFTEDTSSGTTLRSRTWHVEDNYNGDNKLQGYHVKSALETKKKSQTVYSGDIANPVDISLNNVYFHDIMGNGNVWLDNNNSVVVPKGSRPSTSQIENIEVTSLPAVSGPLLMHEERVKTSLGAENVAVITIEARDRTKAPTGQTPTETNTVMPEQWHDLYTITVSRTTVNGAARTIVTMYDHVQNLASLLYSGKSTKEVDYKMVGSLIERATVGVTKKWHSDTLKTVFGIDASVTLQNESTKEPRTIKTSTGSRQVLQNTSNTSVTGNVELTAARGSGELAIGLGASYNGKETNNNSYVRYTYNLGDASLTAKASESGPQGEIAYGPLAIGGGLDGVYASAVIPPLKADLNGDGLKDQILGPLSFGISQDGTPVIAGIAAPLGAATGFGALFTSAARSRTSEKGSKETRANFERTEREYDGISAGHDNEIDKSVLFPAYEAYREDLKNIFVDIDAEILVFKPNITRSVIPDYLPKGAPRELVSMLQNFYEVRTAAILRRELDDLHVKRGRYQSNVGQDLPRIFAANLLTTIFGTRENRNANDVEKEARELANIIDSFAMSGRKAFGFLEGMELSEQDKETVKKAIEAYVTSDPTDIQEANGIFRKIADIQAKGVRVATSPFRAIGRGIGILKPNTDAGTVVKRSFSGIGVKKDLIWQALIEKGFIDEKGSIQDSFRNLRISSEMGISGETITTVAEQKIFDVMQASIAKEQTGRSTWQAPDVSSDAKLSEAFERRLSEDTLYLILRIYADKGSSAQTNAIIGQVLAKLPENIKAEAESFIKRIPVQFVAEAKSTTRVAMPPQADVEKIREITGDQVPIEELVSNPDSETPVFRADARQRIRSAQLDEPVRRQLENAYSEASGRMGTKPVKMVAETFAQSAVDEEIISERIAMEKDAIKEFEGIKSRDYESNIDSLIENIKLAIGAGITSDMDRDRINDDLYKGLIQLFMIAGTNGENAGRVADKLVGETLSQEQRAYIRNGAVTKEMLTRSGMDTEKIWTALIEHRYIHANGAIRTELVRLMDETEFNIGDDLKGSSKAVFDLLKGIRGVHAKVVDFYLSRRPGSTGIFGKEKTEVKVVGMWGRSRDGNINASIKGKLQVEEFVTLAIEGRVKDRIIEQNLRTVAKKDMENIGFRGEALEALWLELLNKGYINQNGYVQPKTLAIESADRFDISEQFADKKAEIFEKLVGARSTKMAFIRDGGRTPNTDESTRAALNITPAPTVQEAADTDEELPSPAKIDESRPVVELAEQNNKEAEKAARRERIKKAQQSYGVGSRRSRQR